MRSAAASFALFSILIFFLNPVHAQTTSVSFGNPAAAPSAAPKPAAPGASGAVTTVAEMELQHEQDAVAEVLALFSPAQRTMISGEKFSVNGCPQVPIAEWLKFILLSIPVTINLAFQDGCDVSGAFTLVPNGTAAETGQIRNFRDFTRFSLTLKTTVHLDLATASGKAHFETGDGKLFAGAGAEPSEFTGFYDLVSKSERPGSAQTWGLSGEITLTKYRGKAIAPRTGKIHSAVAAQ